MRENSATLDNAVLSGLLVCLSLLVFTVFGRVVCRSVSSMDVSSEISFDICQD